MFTVDYILLQIPYDYHFWTYNSNNLVWKKLFWSWTQHKIVTNVILRNDKPSHTFLLGNLYIHFAWFRLGSSQVHMVLDLQCPVDNNYQECN